MKTTTREAPFQGKVLLHYARKGDTWPTGIEWREVAPWREDRMVLAKHVTSGRSAKYVHVVDPAGVAYPMFITDLMKVCTERTVHGGRIVLGAGDRWYVVKRGQNFGLSLLLDGEK